ncbi:uncharacterized protein [Nicotiana tomentosiformis]|uniref:uncharacterized protein n=1 Tax=Nicotiana tomentosiformis TaxID=4098 RepID=UPI00388CC08E
MWQISQDLNYRPKGALPSDMVVNPKGGNNTGHAMDVITRSGRSGNAPTSSERRLVDDDRVMQEEEIPNNVVQANEEVRIDIDDSVEETQEEVNLSREHIIDKPEPSHSINVPLVEALEQMPSYANFMKDRVRKKRSMNFETIKVTHQVSAIVHSMASKLEDPGAFTIPYTIGSVEFPKALCNLGANCEVDYEVSIILERPFLATIKALCDVEARELIFKVGDEKVVFHVRKFMRQPKSNEVDSTLAVLKKRKKAIGWTLADIRGISLAFCIHKIKLEDGAKLSIKHQRRLTEAMQEVFKKEIIKWLDAGVVYPISDSSWNSPVQCFPKKGGMMVVTNDKNELIPTRTMTDWPAVLFIIFLMGTRDTAKFLLLRRIKRKQPLHVPMENCHFMVEEGIIFCHKISIDRIEVDKAKIEVISKLSPPTSMKGVCRFLGHAGFYRCFIKDFSKVVNPLCKLLEKNLKFNFNDDCMRAFELLKLKLTTTPIITAPNWSVLFELMCAASDVAVGLFLGNVSTRFSIWSIILIRP